ncbi:MAG TPA: hypothetical protein VFJ71_12425 [Candidatus Limnocylindrales bacterium]|nr:hypothetical protein [Candidatus Limnocylindrales bacterium]
MATTMHDPDPLTIWPEATIDDGVAQHRWAWLVTLGRAVLTAAILLGALAAAPAGGGDGRSPRAA